MKSYSNGHTDFDSLQRCFACGGDDLRSAGAFHYLNEASGPQALVAWSRDAATLVRCARCGSQGPNRRPSDALLAAWHAQHGGDVTERLTEGHRRAVQRLRGIGAVTLVDVGCGAGTFLDLLPADITRFGLEPSVSSAAFGRARGRRIVAPDADGWSTELPDTVDVITLFDVLADLREPGPFLTRLLARLRPGGRLLLFTGDAGSPWSLRWGIRWWYHGWANHLSCFSADGLSALVSDLGLSCESLDCTVYMHEPPSLRRALRVAPMHLLNSAGALRALDGVRPPVAMSPLGVDQVLMVARAH